MHRLLSCVLLFTITLATIGCAAQRHTERGEAALVSNDPINARHHFMRALEHDPKLAQKPDFVENLRLAKRDAAVAEGEQALRQRRPLVAVERFSVALTHQPNWSPAVEGLARANADAADYFHELALDAADNADLSLARQHLQVALKHGPNHPDAKTALASLSLPAAQQPADYRQAQNERAKQAWDDALANYRQSVSQYPQYLPARAAIAMTLDEGAGDMLERGEQALRENRLEEAEALTLRTREYRPQHPELPPALSRIDLARGERDLAEDLPGAAYEWFVQAHDHVENHGPGRAEHDRATQHLDDVAQLIRDRHRLDIRLTAKSEVRPRLASALTRSVKDLLFADQLAALGFAPEGEEIVINLLDLDLAPAEVTAEQLTHPHTVYFDVPNPKAEDLEHTLAEIDVFLDDLSRAIPRLEKRHHSLNLKSPDAPETLAAFKKLDSARHDYDNARKKHKKLRRRLADTPAFITESRVEYWPYIKLEHHRTVALHAGYMMTEKSKNLRSFSVTVTDHDITLEDVRPDLGLEPDPLQMLSNDELEAELLGLMASRLAQELTDELTQRRIDLLQIEASRLENSDPAAAREARVAAEVLRP
ncbi:MAG: hypothetical protein AAGH99_07575 [Planctomycetota bacterium]